MSVPLREEQAETQDVRVKTRTHTLRELNKNRGPTLYLFSDHYFLRWSSLSYPKKSTDLRKTAFLALSLQPPVKTFVFSFFVSSRRVPIINNGAEIKE